MFNKIYYFNFNKLSSHVPKTCQINLLNAEKASNYAGYIDLNIQPSKLTVWVRFPSPAPYKNRPLLGGFLLILCGFQGFVTSQYFSIRRHLHTLVCTCSKIHVPKMCHFFNVANKKGRAIKRPSFCLYDIIYFPNVSALSSVTNILSISSLNCNLPFSSPFK